MLFRSIKFATSDASDTNVPCHRNRKTAVLSTAAVQANLHVGGRDGAGESGSGPREAAWTCTRLWLIPKYRAINSNWPNSGKKSRTWTATLRLLKLQRKQTPHHIAVKDLTESERFSRLLTERDAAEWRWHHAEHSSGGGEALERALAECCERMHVTPAATVYRVKAAGRSARAFGELP